MRYFISGTYLLAAIVNLAPAIGVLSADMLSEMYAVSIDSAELALLLRHRALLFAIVGGLLLAAAVDSRLRTVAGIAGLVSMLSFVMLFVLTGADNASLNKVTLIDSFTCFVLTVGLGFHFHSRRSSLI